MIFSIRSAQIFSEQRSMNKSRTWTSLSTSACKSMLDWLNWMLDQSSKHQLLKLLTLLSAHRLFDLRHQFLHERNSEDRSSTLFKKSCLRKNSASNARSQNIEHMTVSKRLKCTRSLLDWLLNRVFISTFWLDLSTQVKPSDSTWILRSNLMTQLNIDLKSSQNSLTRLNSSSNWIWRQES